MYYQLYRQLVIPDFSNNIAPMSDKNQKLVFVVHKHDAISLHYDFRIQRGRVMPSWAIPKGPSLDPKDKRLAMVTTDHSLEYRKFEGVLPKGSYGAGPVMIWDMGYYVPVLTKPGGVKELVKDFDDAQEIVKRALKDGELEFEIFGTKLRGSFVLRRWHNQPKKWLLIKNDDAYIKDNYNANEYDFSAVTKRSIKEIENDEDL